MDQNMMALFGMTKGAIEPLGEFYWKLMCLGWSFNYDLDPFKYYRQKRNFEIAKATTSFLMNDISAVCGWAYSGFMEDVRSQYKQIEQDQAKQELPQIQMGLKKPGDDAKFVKNAMVLREADQYDINWVNDFLESYDEAVKCLGFYALYIQDVNYPELQQFIPNIVDGIAELSTFRDSVIPDYLRALDESNLLALTTRTIDTSSESVEEPKDLPLQIKLGGKKVSFSYQEPNDESGLVKEKFSYEFKPLAIDKTLGLIKGTVMPAGNKNRTYLNGHYFNKEIVTQVMYWWMLNSPMINKDHDENDLYYFWEHPDLRVLETYQAPCDFELGGEMVMEGDWMMTQLAISDSMRQKIANGEYQGFSAEGWVWFYDESILAE